MKIWDVFCAIVALAIFIGCPALYYIQNDIFSPAMLLLGAVLAFGFYWFRNHLWI